MTGVWSPVIEAFGDGSFQAVGFAILYFIASIIIMYALPFVFWLIAYLIERKLKKKGLSDDEIKIHKS